MSEISLDLSAIAAGLVALVAACRRPGPPPAPEAPRRPPTYPPASAYDEPPRKRRRWAPWLIVALLIAAAALAGWWAYNQIQEQLEESEPVGVPFVEGLREQQAIDKIEEVGLEAAVEEQSSTEVDRGIVMEQNPKEGTRISKGSTVTIVVSTGPKRVEVPRLVGLTYEEAVDALAELGLESRRVNVFSQKPVGQVTAQDPKAGEEVDEGTQVVVRVSKGVQQVGVPDVLGQSESSATAELEAAGFVVDVVQAPSSTTPAGLVSAQSPDPGVEAEKGSTVQITVSTGPAQVTVPNVVGEDEANARDILGEAGFNVRVVNVAVLDPDQDGIVQSQNPSAGSQANEGSRVTIFVGAAP